MYNILHNFRGVLIIPTTTNYIGPKILLVYWRACDPNKISFISLMKVFFMFLEVLLIDDDCAVIAGVHFWGELKCWPLGYILQCTPPVLKKAVTCFQNAFAFRIKGLYCINTPKPAETVCNVVKAFLSEKIKNRVCIIYLILLLNKIFCLSYK